jgi:hypothetical protein
LDVPETISAADRDNFAELLRDAVRQVAKRKKTRVSKGAKLRRLEKKQLSILKTDRSKSVPIEEQAKVDS